MQKAFLLRSFLPRILCITLMSTLILSVQPADKAKTLAIALSNGFFTYHTLNSLRSQPSKTKYGLAALGCALGYIGGDSTPELAHGSVGHGVGITAHILGSLAGMFPTRAPGSILDNIGISLLDNIGVFLGGVHAGVSCAALTKKQVSLRVYDTVTPGESSEQTPQKPYTFANLAGTIPQDIREVTDFIAQSDKYRAVGAHMPKGILLVGPPGTGKTSIARAIAGEVNAKFIATTANRFIGKYAGQGPQSIQELFDEARAAIKDSAYQKAIIFIDEFDAIGCKRSSNVESGYAMEYRATINELLNQLDGFKQDDDIFVIAATNRHQDLDPALIRAGRFDRIVTVPLPDEQSREAILRLHAAKIKTDGNLNFGILAQKTRGLTCADLANIINEAAIHAVREDKTLVTQTHFEKVFQSSEKYRSRLGS